MCPCRQYREYLRHIRMFLKPKHKALLFGVTVSGLTMDDLEALYELIIGSPPPRPAGYAPRRA